MALLFFNRLQKLLLENFLRCLARNLDTLLDVFEGNVEGRAEADGVAAAAEDEHMLVRAFFEERVAKFRAADVVCTHKSLAANVVDEFGEFFLELLKACVERRAGCVRNVVEYFVVAVDFEVLRRANHVDDRSAPRGVDTARYCEAVLFDFVDARACNKTANLRFFAEREDVGANVVVLPRPHLARDAHAALDFVEDENDVGLVADRAELLHELGAEVVVAAFALDRFEYDCRDSVRIVRDRLFNLFDCLRFKPFRDAEILFDREGHLRVENARPIRKLREALVLVGVVRVGHRKRVTAAAVERFVEVHDFRAFFTRVCFAGGNFTSLQEFADFPVHRDLEGVFDCERTVVDQEEVVVAVGNCDFFEGFDEFRHFLRVDVRVCDFVDRCAEDFFFELGGREFRMVHAEGSRCEERVKVEPVRARAGIDNVASL